MTRSVDSPKHQQRFLQQLNNNRISTLQVKNRKLQRGACFHSLRMNRFIVSMKLLYREVAASVVTSLSRLDTKVVDTAEETPTWRSLRRDLTSTSHNDRTSSQ